MAPMIVHDENDSHSGIDSKQAYRMSQLYMKNLSLGNDFLNGGNTGTISSAIR